MLYVLLTVHLSIILDNAQLGAHLLHFVLNCVYLHYSTSFKHYMPIIRRVKFYRCSIFYRHSRKVTVRCTDCAQMVGI